MQTMSGSSIPRTWSRRSSEAAMNRDSVQTLLGFTLPQNWGDLGTLLGAVASMVAAAIAVIAATYAKRQIEEGRRVQAETLAQEAYSSYLLKAFENPGLAMGQQ